MESKEKESILTDLSWEAVKNEFDSIESVKRALSFLTRVLSEKSICGNKDCPTFPLLREIDGLIFELEKNYGIFDLKLARLEFKNKINVLKSFEEDYWKIKHKLMNAFHEVMRIGIPNEVKQESEEVAQKRSVEFVQKAIEAKDKHALENIKPPDFLEERWKDQAEKAGQLTPEIKEAAEINKKKIEVAKREMERDKILEELKEYLTSNQNVPPELIEKLNSLK